jgi:hypothetical protein
VFSPGVVTGSAQVFRETAINALQAMPGNADHLFVCTGSSQAFLVNMKNQQVLKSFSSGKTTGGDFLCGTVSPQGI